MKTVPIEQAVEQTNASQVFSYGRLGAEHRDAGDNCSRHYSQGLAENFVKECLYGDWKSRLCSTKMSSMMNDRAMTITTTK